MKIPVGEAVCRKPGELLCVPDNVKPIERARSTAAVGYKSFNGGSRKTKYEGFWKHYKSYSLREFLTAH